MARMLDCLVSYFALDEQERPTYRRYFCYHLVAGPGPAAGTGMAVITTLAIFNETERCSSCQHFHVADTGGPAAALAKAARYLDAYHEKDHLRQVLSEVRGQGDEPPAESVVSAPSPTGVVPLSPCDSIPTR
jgi:hypothetical protein